VRDRFMGVLGVEPAAPAEAPRDAGLQGRLLAGLHRLTPNQQAVFVLVHVEEYTVAEAARMMGVAEGTAKSHLHRALLALRADLGDLP
jgi:RNA polymerase sigma-70 factor (ECF subfamily)